VDGVERPADEVAAVIRRERQVFGREEARCLALPSRQRRILSSPRRRSLDEGPRERREDEDSARPQDPPELFEPLEVSLLGEMREDRPPEDEVEARIVQVGRRQNAALREAAPSVRLSSGDSAGSSMSIPTKFSGLTSLRRIG
jgi:hypothetical protein